MTSKCSQLFFINIFGFSGPGQRSARGGSGLTDKELDLEVVSLGERPAEGDPHHPLLAAADHQQVGVVAGGEVVGFVDRRAHVNTDHRQIWRGHRHVLITDQQTCHM